MGADRQLTIEEAKTLAERWEAEYEDFAYEQRLTSRFRGAKPVDVVRMWDSGRNEDGKKLTRFEVQALAQRWGELFGCLPPCGDAEPAPVIPSEPEPAGDPTLNMREVTRLTGLSESTIKRRVADGSFPVPSKLSPRRIGWPASAVKAWRDALDRNRRGERD
jgi:predicted DNA-binding transcriptional regulator AlpA